MQRINLYQDELKEAKVLLPARQMLVIAGLALAGMAALGSWSQTWSSGPRAEADAIQKQADQQDQVVRGLQDQVARMAPNEALVRQAEALQSRLRNTRLMRQAVAPSRGLINFSWYLEGLGRQSRDSIWLTEIRIGDQGRTFLLRGGTLDPSLVPEYIQSLENEPIYAGLSFDNLSMSLVEDDLPHLQFSISTRCLPDEECGK